MRSKLSLTFLLLLGAWRGGTDDNSGGAGTIVLVAAQSTSVPSLAPTPANVTSASTPSPVTPAPTPSPNTPAPTPSPNTPAPTPSPNTPAPTPSPNTPVPTIPRPTAAPTHEPTPAPTVYTTQAPTPWRGISYHPSPLLRWIRRLPGSGSQSTPAPRRGNAVQISPDDAFVYVTMDDGTLHVLDAADGGSTRGTHSPGPTQSGWTVICSSGVSFGRREAGVGEPFAVYAVVDVPPAGSPVKSRVSRVIAVSHPSGEELWTSPQLDGEIAGTPMVGDDGKYIYLNRNVGSLGHFTLLSVATKGDVFFTEVSGQFNKNETGAYAPLALARNPKRGNYNGGLGNENDVATWAYSYYNGTAVSLNGYTKAFQLPDDFEEDLGSDPSVLKTVSLQDVSWSTISRPAMAPDGMSMYFSISRAEMRGWHNQRFGRGPWKAQLQRNPVVGTMPLPNTAAISYDGLTLFAGSASNFFYAINATSGDVLWTSQTESEVVPEPRVSPNDDRVYSIQSNLGKVAAHNTSDGLEIWAVNCPDFKEVRFCSISAEAEFSISSTGYYLYYADNFGWLTALTLGFEPPPTAAPTFAPTAKSTPSPTSAAPTKAPTRQPTFVPSGVPTLAPVPTYTPTAAPTHSGPTTESPTAMPTATPTVSPTMMPTASPITAMPTPEGYTRPPTMKPTDVPTAAPSVSHPPTSMPTAQPSEATDPPGSAIGSGGATVLCKSWWAPLISLAYLLFMV